jgi:hypothetical protein
MCEWAHGGCDRWTGDLLNIYVDADQCPGASVCPPHYSVHLTILHFHGDHYTLQSGYMNAHVGGTCE